MPSPSSGGLGPQCASRRDGERMTAHPGVRRLLYRGGTLALVAAVAAGCASAVGPQSQSARQLLAHATGLEAQILRSGQVTFGDYYLVTQQTVNCLRTAGYTVTQPAVASSGLINYVSSLSYGSQKPTTAQLNEGDSAEQRCQSLSAAVQAVYILQHAASAQQVAAAFAELTRCARRLGVPVGEATYPTGVGSVYSAIQDAVSQRLISNAQANACLDPYSSVSLQPLPGLKQALAAYLR